MKGSIFVDTSAWYALADIEDANHGRAKAFVSRALAEYRVLVSTNHVVGEAYTLIRYRLGHGAAWRFMRSTANSGRFKSVFVTEALEVEAYALLERYTDHAFSFVDGTSFVVMKAQGISTCFAFDRHFEAAGFVALPGPV